MNSLTRACLGRCELKYYSRFHFLDLMLSVAVVTLFFRARILVVTGTALRVVAAGFGSAVEVILSDSGNVAL